jgi:uncharacterized protein
LDLNDNSQFIARKIKRQEATLLNICDEELLGKTVEGNGITMSISRDYFGVEKVSDSEAVDLIEEATIITLAGSRIVEKAISEELASRLAVKNIGGVDFLMIYKFT